MPDRLSDLVRQRALVLEQLAWIDREIAGIKAKSDLPAVELPSPSNPQTPAPSQTTPTRAVAAIPPADLPVAETEELLDQYRVPPATLKNDVRKGCYLYFAGAFVLLGIFVAVLYFAISYN